VETQGSGGLTHAHICAHNTHVHTYTCAHMYTDLRKSTYEHTCPQLYTQNTRAQAHTHTHTHTHIHICAPYTQIRMYLTYTAVFFTNLTGIRRWAGCLQYMAYNPNTNLGTGREWSHHLLRRKNWGSASWWPVQGRAGWNLAPAISLLPGHKKKNMQLALQGQGPGVPSRCEINNPSCMWPVWREALLF
jgi:hypothetical protein